MKRLSSSKTSEASRKKKKITSLEFINTPVVTYALKMLYGFPFITNNHDYKYKKINCRYLSDVKDLKKNDVLIIKSPMGSGKTTLFLQIIKQYDRILIVSCRRSYSAYMCTVVPGLINYLNIKGPISAEDHPRVIIQVQSLHRIKAIKTETTFAQWDIVYIDEPNGVFNEIISPVMVMKERKNLSKYLRVIVSNIPKVIITDAGLAPWHLDAINKYLLSGLSRRKMCIINENATKNHHVKVFDSLLISYTNYSLVFCSKLKNIIGQEGAYIMETDSFFAGKQGSVAKDLFISLVNRAYKLYRDQYDSDLGAYLRYILLHLHENAVVLCNTKRQAYLMGSFTQKLLGKASVVIITGDTPMDVKSTFMKDPRAGLQNKRVLVHTTCISVGVDLNFYWATQTFLIIDGMNKKHMPCVIDMYQGLGRNRQSTHINIFVNDRRLPLKRSTNDKIAVDHMDMVESRDETPWKPSSWSEYQLQSDVIEDSLDAVVLKVHKFERSFNGSPRLFFDMILSLLQVTSMADIEYRQPTWEPVYELLGDDVQVKKAVDACKKLFSKTISKYTTLTLQSFNDFFEEHPAEKEQILKNIVEALKLFKGDFPTSFFVIRNLDENILKQWAISFCKLRSLEPTGAVDMLNFDKEAAFAVDPKVLITRVKKRLYKNNNIIKTYTDFDSAITHTHALLDKQDFTEHLEPLTRLLVDEYEIGSSRQTTINDIARETGLMVLQDRFILPTINLKVNIHKMAALLLL